MTRVVSFESGWLARQIDSAQKRASQYPNWLTRPSNSDSQNRNQNIEAAPSSNGDDSVSNEPSNR